MKDRVSDSLTADDLKAVLLEDGGQVPLGHMVAEGTVAENSTDINLPFQQGACGAQLTPTPPHTRLPAAAAPPTAPPPPASPHSPAPAPP